MSSEKKGLNLNWLFSLYTRDEILPSCMGIKPLFSMNQLEQWNVTRVFSMLNLKWNILKIHQFPTQIKPPFPRGFCGSIVLWDTPPENQTKISQT